MPRKPLKKPKSLSVRLSNFGRSNLLIACAFVLVFVSFGAWFVVQSEAAGSCVSSTWFQGESGSCVQAIESMLDHYHSPQYPVPQWLKSGCPASNPTCAGGYYDGIFGPKTRADVVAFQYDNGIQGGNGQVGQRTWIRLCDIAKSIVFRDYNDYQRAGCTALTGNFYSY